MSSILSGHESFDTKLWKFQFAYQTSYDTHVDDGFIKKNTINLSSQFKASILIPSHIAL